MKNQAKQIQQFLIKNIPEFPSSIVKQAMEQFAVSRTTILRHLNRLINEDLVIKSGTTKQTIYNLRSALSRQLIIDLTPNFDEFAFFNKELANVIKQHSNTNTFEICEYGITELLNNGKDHSKSNRLTLSLFIKQNVIYVEIIDEGVGLLSTLIKATALTDKKEIILELSKGKLTSDPANHTGEGLFFTSRAFDYFSFSADGYKYIRDNRQNDWAIEISSVKQGTKLQLEISCNTNKKLPDIFNQYTDNNYAFTKTDLIVKLANKYGERLISRSQANRVIRNLEKFNYVTFDFKDIETVGQGFADQLFRVFQQQQPHITLNYINANEVVEFMIKRARAVLA